MILTSIYVAESINSIWLLDILATWASINSMWFANANMQHWLNSVYSYLHSSCMSGQPHPAQLSHKQKGVGSNPLIGTAIIFFPVDMLSTFYLFIGCLFAPRMHKHMHRHTIHDTNTPSTHPSTHPHPHWSWPSRSATCAGGISSYQLTQKHNLH